MTKLSCKLIVSLVLSFIFSQVTSAVAQAQVVCSSASTCYVKGMPLYDQKSPGLLNNWGFKLSGKMVTNLCVATSMSMAMTSLVNANKVKAKSVSSKFKVLSPNRKIDYIARLIKTNRQGGALNTVFPKFYLDRKKDFVRPFAGEYRQNTTKITVNASYLLGQLKKKRVSILGYGHYKVTRKVMSSGSVRYTYKRYAGHVMAINRVAGATVTFNDPWGARVIVAPVRKLASIEGRKKINHILPSFFSAKTARQIKVTPTYAALVELSNSLGRR